MAHFKPQPFGKYTLLEKLAVGGMAEIYKAKTFGAEGFEKELAIKRILPHAAEDKEFINMLIDEAKLSVLLSHANIVQVYDLGKVGQDYFISMEYIHGINFRDILYKLREKNQRMPTDLAVYVASEVCKGLDYAHRKTDANNQPLGIVHRDVSPQNILISFEGEVKIVDFGIAKAAMNISHTMAGILKGKIAYMSPEQAMGKQIDARTDLFSLGILLYEALSGKKLFTGDSQFEVLKKIRTTRINIGKLPETIPPSLKPILAKALAYEVEDRFASAGDLQVALTKYLYSTYTDFSPRKLAVFVKEQFQEEVQKEKGEEDAEKILEIKTSTIGLAGPSQENIVHRETTPAKALGRGKTSKSVTISETFPEPKPRTKWPWAAGLSIFLVAGLAFLSWKFFTPPSPPAAAEAMKGTLQIFSEPAGAAIFLNGEATGYKTPAILEDLEVGKTHAVALTLEKYGREEKSLSIANADPVSLSFSLTKHVGVLNVISEPSGASILVNNIATGKVTPATLDDLALNSEYKVTLSKPGYEDFEQPISLASTQPQKMMAALRPIELPPPVLPVPPATPAPPVITEPVPPPAEPKPPIVKEPIAPKPSPVEPKPPVVKEKPAVTPKPLPPPAPIIGGEGSIRVTSSPSGADIFVDGVNVGQTPATIKAKSGAVRVLVTEGGETLPCRQTVQVQPGKTSSVTCALGALFGQISINSSPPRAEVYLDGKLLGKTPIVVKKVKRDQEHTLRLVLEGFRPWSHSFQLQDREKKSFNVELEP